MAYDRTFETVSVGGVMADVYIDGYEKGNGAGGPWRDIVYICDWEESDKFMDNLIGVAPVVSTANTPIAFPQPHRYPGNKNLACLEVHAKNGGKVKPAPAGIDANGNPDPTQGKLFSADFAFVTAHYAVPRYDIFGEDANVAFGGQPVPWCNDSIRGYTANYQIPAGVLKGKDTDEPNDKAMSFDMPHEEWTRSRKMFGYLFTDTLDELVGSVNLNPIFNKPMGQMLFQPYNAASGTYSDGSRMIDLDISWLWRPVDWNAKISKAPPFNWEIQWDGANFAYPYKDHAVLATDSLV